MNYVWCPQKSRTKHVIKRVVFDGSDEKKILAHKDDYRFAIPRGDRLVYRDEKKTA